MLSEDTLLGNDSETPTDSSGTGSQESPVNLEEKILREVHNALNGFSSRLTKQELPKLMEKSLQEQMQSDVFAQALAKALLTADRHLESQEPPVSDPSAPKTPESSVEPNKSDPEVVELRNKLSETQRQLVETQQMIRQEKQANLEKEKAAQRQAELSKTQLAVTEVVTYPDQLLVVLQAEGLARFNDQNQLVIKTTDVYGLEVEVPAAQEIRRLIETDRYKHYAKPRPGGGAGGRPGAAPTSPQIKVGDLKDFSTAAKLADDPDQIDALFNQISG